MPDHNVKRAVVTALIGDYERPLFQPMASRSVIPFLCFTDNPRLAELDSGWRVVRVDRHVTTDSVRSARFLKIVGHPMLDEFDEVLWIDNRVILAVDPRDIFDQFAATADLAIPTHSMRDRLSEEFEAVMVSGYDDPRRIRAQELEYRTSCPEILDQKPFWTGLMLRRQNERVQKFQRVWMEHVLLFSRRDQLSVLYAIARAGANVQYLKIDNVGSRWHEWVPVNQIARKRSVMNWGSGRRGRNALIASVDAARATRVGRAFLRLLANVGISTTFLSR